MPKSIAALPFLLLARAAHAQVPLASLDQAQELLSRAFDRSTFGANHSPPATGRYERGRSDGCLTRYRLVIPQFAVGSRTYAAVDAIYGLDWTRVRRVTWDGRIRVDFNDGATQWFAIEDQARRALFLRASEYLIPSCNRSAAAAPRAPVPATAPGARAAIPVNARFLEGAWAPAGRECRVLKIEFGPADVFSDEVEARGAYLVINRDVFDFSGTWRLHGGRLELPNRRTGRFVLGGPVRAIDPETMTVGDTTLRRCS